MDKSALNDFNLVFRWLNLYRLTRCDCSRQIMFLVWDARLFSQSDNRMFCGFHVDLLGDIFFPDTWAFQRHLPASEQVSFYSYSIIHSVKHVLKGKPQRGVSDLTPMTRLQKVSAPGQDIVTARTSLWNHSLFALHHWCVRLSRENRRLLGLSDAGSE